MALVHVSFRLLQTPADLGYRVSGRLLEIFLGMTSRLPREKLGYKKVSHPVGVNDYAHYNEED